MIQRRKDDVERRNVTLHPDTYAKLDKYLLELMQKRNSPKLSRNDAIEALLEEHYSKN
jgi:hypothetical protein